MINKKVLHKQTVKDIYLIHFNFDEDIMDLSPFEADLSKATCSPYIKHYCKFINKYENHNKARI